MQKPSASTTVFAIVTRFAVIGFLTVLVHGQEGSANRIGVGSDVHGWLGTETLKTRFGDFEFAGGYPAVWASSTLRPRTYGLTLTYRY